MENDSQSIRRRSGLGVKKLGGSPRRNSPIKRRRSTLSGAEGPGVTNIKVSVRVRPSNERESESEGGLRSIIDVVDEKLLIFDPKVDDDDFYFHGKLQRRRDLNKRPKKDHKFTFDRVFGPGEDNEVVFQNTALDLVEALFSGYNSSIFVYGATGAGKTFTMLGSPGNPGITFKTVKAIYERIEASQDELSCEVAISYLEIYNENVIDLINPGGVPLNVREDGKTGVNIPGLTRHKPKTPEELLKLLQHGNSNRSQHPTDANAESSRSHAVFQVFLTQKDRSSGLSADVKTAKLSMIDLAGSERGTVTSNRGGCQKKGRSKYQQVSPCFRELNSKLTRLLKDSLGGNCRTVMISNVSPSGKTYEDTYNTLKYAERAKKIQVKLKKNVTSVDFHVAQYAKIVENLKQEISELKEKIKINELKKKETMDFKSGEKIRSLENENQRLKNENYRLKKEKADNDNKCVDLSNGVAFQKVKMSHSQIVLDRNDMISSGFGFSKISSAHKNCLKTLKDLQGSIDELESQKAHLYDEYFEAKIHLISKRRLCK
ncbi:KIF18_19 [Lepeophtheirus salmonis]|uniref:Kinesin-like protein n=1 Tax=Lepeophtheirus salmonis TaxID=72036 RepID=A0A7R8CV07_LEPSM|nr:KIF18_19 [Lepeophtheirus salmonis]CAF2939503.1 KIF18_19 [Lepeophtheirus salmonis]